MPEEVHEEEIWQKNIAWSNLYKVSPKDCDNPSWEDRRLQQEVCKEIMKKELSIYQPTHILIISGYAWFEPFAELFSDVVDTGKRNVSKGKNKNTVYVEGTAKYGNARVVIACRPEWRDKEGYVAAVSQAFHSK